MSESQREREARVRSVSSLAVLLLGMLLCIRATGAEPQSAKPGMSPTNSPTAKPQKPNPAKFKISGYGFLGDLQLKKSIELLILNNQKPEIFDANFVEDASLILASTLRRDGYLQPGVSAQLTLENGERLGFKWEEPLQPLARPLRIRKVRFKIHKGVVYHYQQIKIEGLTIMPEKKARAYFVETGLLLPLKVHRVYTPERLSRSLSSLTLVLERQGYEQAKAAVSELSRDDKTGAVNVRVRLEEGRKSVVRSVRNEFFYAGETEPKEVTTVFPNKPYSRLWQQDYIQGLQTNAYHRGYPDTRVELQTVKREQVGEVIQLDLISKVQCGVQVTLGTVGFRGQKKAKKSMMRRRVRLQEDSLLDRIKVEQGRYRLARLGIFDSVELSYDTVNQQTRNVTYKVAESKTTDINLLAGYGSYELLRGGFELERRDILGRAHHARLKVVQSFKSSSGEFVYTMPEMIGQDVDAFINGSGLRREEISFVREEYGGGAGVHKYFKEIFSDLSVRYNYEVLNAAETEFVATDGLQNPGVGAIIAEMKHDRRDSPLYPHRGYKVFSTVESATRYLGGDVNYERVEVSTSFHQALGKGTWVHLGLTHGAVVPFGSAANNLAFNKRFFPGGDTSLRGYQQDQASPKDISGKVVGAETFTLGTVEFEQALTPKWSLVVFSDSLGQARRIQHYPFDTGLYSVGVGLNWRTIIGPIRVEYGRNLNPRPGDPSGTVHFSLGFPF